MREHAIPDIRRRLLRWYDEHRRELPWRVEAGEPVDAYRVWLSEVMLQQTRVETVKPYYERWLERFPTLGALADAPLDEVLRAWEGLGYYSRARNLHRAVREVNDRYAGRVPDDPAEFRALPGVGRYTAGAVMSIAFGREEPLVDGNVRRVYARWMDEPEPEESELWRMSGALVPGERPGDLNQALMELGATVCTPRSPRCGACPVREHCAASAHGTQHERPAPRRARPVPHEDHAVAVVAREGALLLARRPTDSLLGGLWEFPTAARREDETTAEAAARALREGTGLESTPGDPVGSVPHAFSHLRVTYHAVRCSAPAGDPAPLLYDAVAWVAPAELERYALPKAQRKIEGML